MKKKKNNDMNTKTWKPHESDVRETYEVFQKEFLTLIDKVNNYWYGKTDPYRISASAPNQSARLIQVVMKKFFTKKKIWCHRKENIGDTEKKPPFKTKF